MLETLLAGEFDESQLKVDLVKDSLDINHDTFEVVLQNTSEVLYNKEDDDDLDLGEVELRETDTLNIITKIGTWLAAQPK
jgi:hypothetical protein